MQKEWFMYDPLDGSMVPEKESRADKRDSMILMSNAKFETGGAPFQMRVRNISATGLRADITDHIEPGSRILVELRNIGWVLCTVRWVDRQRCGMAFDGPIDPERARQPLAERSRMSIEAQKALLRRHEIQRTRSLNN